MKVGVIAGTPVDTYMGVDYLKSKDESLDCLPMMVADCPVNCHLFQLLSMEEKHEKYVAMFQSAMKDGIRDFFIYCNSVSGTFDFDGFAREMGVRIYTPLQVYRELGASYKKVSVIAANNQSTAGIEKSLYTNNPDISVMGLGYLELVNGVEQRIPPGQLIKDFSLDRLMGFFEANEAQCIILGCTHFPYFKEELQAVTSMEVIDPADLMYRNLMEGWHKAEKAEEG